MKKLFFIAAIAGAALVSCTKNELAPSATEQHEITFASPVTSTLTKAVDLVSGQKFPSNDNTAFYVFADHHMKPYGTAENTYTSYMRGTDQKGVAVTYQGGGIQPGNDNPSELDAYWGPVTKYYWPMEGYLTFAAYSTGTNSSLDGTYYTAFSYSHEKGIQVTNYFVDTKLTNQYDLMLSEKATDKTKSSMSEGTDNIHYDGVEIRFNHVLSAIKFAVKTDETDAEYSDAKYTLKLTSLNIVNAYSKANLIQFPSGDEKLWSSYSEEGTYNVGATAGTPLSKDAVAFSGDTYADLALLPQALSHSTTSKNVTVEIVYTVSHPDMGIRTDAEGEPVTDAEGKPIYNSITYTKYLSLAGTGTTADGNDTDTDPDSITVNSWEAGKRYIYTIIIGMEEIKFAPTIVTDWSDVTIDVPENAVVPSTGA